MTGSYSPKILLRAPLKEAGLLEPFVEKCLRDQVVLIAVVGDGCRHLEDLIDEIVVGDGSDQSRFIVTTSHPDDSVEDAIEFATHWPCEDGRDGVEIIEF